LYQIRSKTFTNNSWKEAALIFKKVLYANFTIFFHNSNLVFMISIPTEVLFILFLFLILIGGSQHRNIPSTPVIVVQSDQHPENGAQLILSIILICMLIWIGFCNNAGPSSTKRRTHVPLSLYNIA
jgi:hypothetical protein